METLEVKVEHSSQVDAISYNSLTEVLVITFKNGKKYVYEEVPAEKVSEMIASDSVGKYLNAHIKPNYKATPFNG